MYRKRKRHKNKKGRSGEKYNVIYSSSLSSESMSTKKGKKEKKKTILGLEPILFNKLCESVPLSHGITISNVKYFH